MTGLEHFKGLKALVVGDVMIDTYTKGVVERMSPEAPVPIVNAQSHFSRLGGAANVALNLKALGAEPVVFSVVGKDRFAETLLQLMQHQELDCHGILQSPSRKTTVKHRIFDNDRQVLRIDEEDTFDLSDSEYRCLFDMIENRLRKESFNVIVLQDYNKGVLSEKMIQSIIALANKEGIPVVVDPKKKNFFAYHGVTLFKPNAKELREGLGVTAETPQALQQAMLTLQQRLACEYLMVTLSEQGVMILHNGQFHHISAVPRKIVDVSGAGDTVLSVAALCVVLGENAETIATLSNIAGGLVCESAGVLPIDKGRFQQEIQRLSIAHD